MWYIFIILIDISWCRWASCMFKDLIILRISSLLKSSEHKLSWVNYYWFDGSTLPFFKGVYCFAKNLLEIFAFVLISVTNFLSIKRGGISSIYLSLYKVLKMKQYGFTLSNGLFIFLARFSWYNTLVELIISLSSVIRFSRTIGSLSFRAFCVYCL